MFLRGSGSRWGLATLGGAQVVAPAPAGAKPVVASSLPHLSELSAGLGRVLINCKWILIFPGLPKSDSPKTS